MKTISVIGAGAWGTAVSEIIAKAGHKVFLHTRNSTIISEINKTHRNSLYLPKIILNSNIFAVEEGDELLQNIDAIFLAVPAQVTREVAGKMAPKVSPGIPIVICSKGIETNSCKLLSEILVEYFPKSPLAILSGPTFAVEAAFGLPTAVTLACKNYEVGEKLAKLINTPTFRTYYCDDVIGAQIGGAVKNVLAIACGIVVGRNLGENARAALISRGLAEIIRLGKAKGAKIETLMGLSGIGDLALTCTAMQSRNYSLGVALGKGNNLNKFLAKRRAVTEGVDSALSVKTLATKLDIEMPICNAVYNIVGQSVEITEIINELLNRPIKNEY